MAPAEGYIDKDLNKNYFNLKNKRCNQTSKLSFHNKRQLPFLVAVTVNNNAKSRQDQHTSITVNSNAKSRQDQHTSITVNSNAKSRQDQHTSITVISNAKSRQDQHTLILQGSHRN